MGKALKAQSAPTLTQTTMTRHHHLRLAEPGAHQTQYQQVPGQPQQLATNVLSMYGEIIRPVAMTKVMMVVGKGSVEAMANQKAAEIRL
jgi:hypothetical protein